MYLAIMLIIVSLLVFYNEINSKMNIAEIALLAITLIAIIRASMNYIQYSDTFKKIESFTSTPSRKHRTSRNASKSISNNLVNVMSEQSKEYFDTDEEDTIETSRSANSSNDNNTIDTNAVDKIDSLFKEKFADNTPPTITVSGVESVFRPEIIIGTNSMTVGASNGSSNGIGSSAYGTSLNHFGTLDSNSLASSSASIKSEFNNKGDGMSFSDTMSPNKNLWSSDLDYMDLETNWSQSLNSYNHGKWNPQLYKKPSDYIDYYNPSDYGMSTPKTTIDNTIKNKNNKDNFDNTPTVPSTTNPERIASTKGQYGETKRLCGAYDDLSVQEDGTLLVKNYTKAKKWFPGYTYVPPVHWDVPQKHTPVCSGAEPNGHKLLGIVDRGLPLNVLELNPDGTQANTEDEVTLTNVGSILPKFTYQEPYSVPYI